MLANLPPRSVVIVDGLALGALPDEITLASVEAARRRARASSTRARDRDPRALRRTLRQTEQRALAVVRRVVVTSHATVGALADYDVPAEQIVVEPGTDPAPLANGSGGETVQLLCVATLIARKGHDMLFRALADVRERNWRLRCVGSERDPAVGRRLRDSGARSSG